MLKQLLFSENANIRRRAYFWNLVTSAAFAVQSAVFLLVITHIGGEAEAGSFIILFTVAQTLYSIGNYSIRDFQVSDVRGEYPFPVYYTARVVTTLAMALTAAGYCIWKQLPADRVTVLLFLIGYRITECFEDVRHGMIQKAGRFDAACICSAARILLSSAVFCVVYAVTMNQVTASLALLLTTLLVHGITTLALQRQFSGIRPGWRLQGVLTLLTACFPMFIGGFMNSYLITAPKYAIDDLLNGEAQTVFNILLMPVFMINLLSLFVYKPVIVRMSMEWNEGKTELFQRHLIRQGILIFGLTVVIAAGGNLIGLTLLEIIYGVPLKAYRMLFTWLLLFGGVGALAFYLNAIITIVRKQRMILVGYGLGLAVSLLLTRRMVGAYGIAGAGYAYGIIMGTLLLFDLAVVGTVLYQRKRNGGMEGGADCED